MFKTATLTFALLFAAASVAAAQAAASAYAPGSHRYRITREAKSTQEMMGQTQSGTVTTYEELTLDLRAAGRDSMRFSFTIDSTFRQSDLPGAGESGAAKGRKISGQLSARGMVHQFDKDSTGVADVSAGYRNFLPQLPAGGVKAGMMWSDTLQTPFSQGGIEGTTVTIIASRVLGDTTVGGQKAWRIERIGTLSMSGTGNQQGTDLILNGAGTANGVSYIGETGVYLGATSTQDLSITVEVPAASMTIPISQTTLTKVERIPAPAKR